MSAFLIPPLKGEGRVAGGDRGGVGYNPHPTDLRSATLPILGRD
jgi:hypothetical protein